MMRRCDSLLGLVERCHRLYRALVFARTYDVCSELRRRRLGVCKFGLLYVDTAHLFPSRKLICFLARIL